MSNIIISTTEDYIVVKIPRKSLVGRQLSGKKTLTENEALKIFNEAKKDYKAGRLKEIDNLVQLL